MHSDEIITLSNSIEPWSGVVIQRADKSRELDNYAPTSIWSHGGAICPSVRRVPLADAICSTRILYHYGIYADAGEFP